MVTGVNTASSLERVRGVCLDSNVDSIPGTYTATITARAKGICMLLKSYQVSVLTALYTGTQSSLWPIFWTLLEEYYGKGYSCPHGQC
jgi:hypothetical protein